MSTGIRLISSRVQNVKTTGSLYLERKKYNKHKQEPIPTPQYLLKKATSYGNVDCLHPQAPHLLSQTYVSLFVLSTCYTTTTAVSTPSRSVRVMRYLMHAETAATKPFILTDAWGLTQ